MTHQTRIWAAVVAAIGTGSVAFAQQAPAPVSDALEEVVVTAERVETNIQTTPIAITAISGDQLKDMQLVTVTDLQKSVPNLQVLDAGPYQSINIRGIGNTAITPSIVPGVAVTHDGLLSPETIFIGEPFMDIQDVEVLRGPQGTLVGASSTGGAVQIKSKDPDFKGVNGYAEFKLGNYQDQQVTAAINLPINDQFAARIAVNYENRKSFSRNDANLSPQALGAYPLGEPGSVHDRNARIGLLWKPSDKYEAVFKITLNSSNTEGTAGEPNQNTFTTTGACPDLTPMPVGQTVQTCHSLYYRWSTHKPYEINYNLPYSVQATTANRYSLDQHWSLNNGMSVRSLTGVQNLDGGDRWQDDDFSSAPAATHYKDVGPNNSYYSQEFEVKSKQDQPVSWIAGAIWFYRDTPVSNTGFTTRNFFANADANTNAALAQSQGIVPFDILMTYPAIAPGVNPDFPAGLAANTVGGTRITYSSTHTVQRTEGLYANLKWQINPKLDLQVGIRGNWDQNFVHVPNGVWPGLAPGFNSVRLEPGIPVGGDSCNIGLPSNTPQAQLKGGMMVGNVWYHCTFRAAAQTQQSDSVPTGKIGLNWEPIDGQFLYAFYARGYKSGGVRIRSTSAARPFGDYPTIPTAQRNGFKPETVDDFELGWKSTMFDNHLRTSLGLYYMNYHDMQLTQFNPALAANGVDNIQSASTISGVEFTANGRWGGWGTDFSMTLGHSKLGNTDLVATYRTPASFAGQVQCTLVAGVCTGAGVDYTPYVVHLNGVEQPYSPKISANLAVNYRIPVGDDGEIMPQINYAYTGSQFTQVYQAAADGNFFQLDARRLWNLSVKYSTGQWESQIYCNNCGGEVWIAGDGGVSQGNVWYYGSPRQFGVRFNRKF
jgi:iron complex outermembrane receptor protein